MLGLEEGESVWWWLQVESTEIFSVPNNCEGELTYAEGGRDVFGAG